MLGSVRQAGYEAGYLPMRVNLKRRTVTFHRSSTYAATVRVSEVFLKNKVPVDATTELEQFLSMYGKSMGFNHVLLIDKKSIAVKWQCFLYLRS